MKTQTILIAFLAISCLFMTSCGDEWDAIEDEFDCKKGKGARIERELSLAEFTGIELDVQANVFISLGTEQRVVVEGQSNVVNDIELDVQGKVWEIEFDRCYKNYDDLDIFITVTDLTKLELNSSGNIVSQTDFTANQVALRITGSGNIIMNDLDASGVSSTITGSGSILLSGSATTHDVFVTGSGDVGSFGFVTTNSDISIVGSGDVEVNVSSDLDVGIAGSGSVYYKGDPNSVSSSISGSGNVIKVD